MGVVAGYLLLKRHYKATLSPSLNIFENMKGINKEEKEETLRDEIKRKMLTMLQQFKDWLLPPKEQPLLLKLLVFLIKLPVLLIVLALSPVFIIILLLVFFMAL